MAQACKSFKRLLSMTTYLKLGFACHAKGNLLLSPSLSGLQPLCYPASNRHPHFSYCPCFAPATLGFRFITRKETLDTCCKSRQGSTSSLNSPFFSKLLLKEQKGAWSGPNPGGAASQDGKSCRGLHPQMPAFLTATRALISPPRDVSVNLCCSDILHPPRNPVSRFSGRSWFCSPHLAAFKNTFKPKQLFKHKGTALPLHSRSI